MIWRSRSALQKVKVYKRAYRSRRYNQGRFYSSMERRISSLQVNIPSSVFAMTSTMALDRLMYDQIPDSRIDLLILYWAEQRGDISLVTISHTSKRYMIGILQKESRAEPAAEAYRQVQSIVPLFSPQDVDTYVFGPAHSDASLFMRHGLHVVFNERN